MNLIPLMKKHLLMMEVQTMPSYFLRTDATESRWFTRRESAACQRTVYRTICRSRHDGELTCQEIPYTEHYTCMREFQDYFVAFSYHVNTKAILNLENNSKETQTNIGFKVKVNEEESELSLQASTNASLIAPARKEIKSYERRGTEKNIVVAHDINLIDSKKITFPLSKGISNPKLKQGIINFVIAKELVGKGFVKTLKLIRRRRLASDIVVFKDTLSENHFSVQYAGELAIVSISLKKLIANIPKRLKVNVRFEYRPKDLKVLKLGAKTSTSATWRF